MNSRLTRIVVALVLLGIFSSAHAITYTWTGTGTGNWSNSANWLNGIVPVPGPSTTIQFSSNGATAFSANNDLASPFQLLSLGFVSTATPTEFLTGFPLEFTSLDPVAATPQILLTNGVAQTINNDLIFDVNTNVGSNSATSTLTLTGTTSGPGKMSQALGRTNFTGTFGHTGGIEIRGGTLSVSGSTNLGAGPITFAPTSFSPRLLLASAANAQDETINNSGGWVQFTTLDQAAINKFTTNSTGTLALSGNYSAPIDLSTHPNLRIGTYVGTSTASTITLSSPITTSGNAYYFGGTDGVGTTTQAADLLVVSSLLTDGPTLQGRSVQIPSARGSRVKLSNPANSFSGGLVIGSGSPQIMNGLIIDFTATPGQTQLGTGDVTVSGVLSFEGASGTLGALPNNFIFKPGSTLLFNNIVATSTPADGPNRWPDSKAVNLDSSDILFQTASTTASPIETIGPVSFNDACQITIDRRGANVTTMKVGSLSRVGRGTMLLFGTQTNAFAQVTGGTIVEKFQIADASNIVSPTNGMVAPYIIGDDNSSGTALVGWFLAVDPSGNFIAQPTTTFNSASEDEVVGLTTANTTINDETAHAVRMPPDRILTINPGKLLIIKSGGLIMGGNTNPTSFPNNGTLTGGTVFFSGEGLIFVNNRNATIASSLSGTQGITKFGGANLTLAGANNFSGGLLIQEGGILIGNARALNDGEQPNPVKLFGGLDLNGFNLTLRSLTGTGTVRNGLLGTSSTFTLETNSDSEFAGRLFDFAGVIGDLRFVKTGPATLTLSGASPSFTGLTTLSEGGLVMSGSNLTLSPYLTAANTQLTFRANYTVGNIDGAGTTTVDSGTTLSANHLRQGSLFLNSASRLTINPNGSSAATSTFNSLNIAGSADNWDATLDLKNNSLIVDGGNLPTIVNQIKSGLQSGKGIVSSTAGSSKQLAAILNDNGAGSPLYTTFQGIDGLDGNEVLVRYVFTGDLNLDGQVSIADFIDLAAHFGQAGTWREGDLNFDGSITIADFIDLASNFGHSLAGTAQPSQADWQTLAAFANANDVSLVPEPTWIACWLAAALGARRRRR